MKFLSFMFGDQMLKIFISIETGDNNKDLAQVSH
jgi:hypothetical protein